MSKLSAQTLIFMSRMACDSVAVGPFTPIVFERYNRIGGDSGWILGYPSQTLSGFNCIVWV